MSTPKSIVKLGVDFQRAPKVGAHGVTLFKRYLNVSLFVPK